MRGGSASALESQLTVEALVLTALPHGSAPPSEAHICPKQRPRPAARRYEARSLKLDDARVDEEHPYNYALVRAVLNWYRTGIAQPIPIDETVALLRTRADG